MTIEIEQHDRSWVCTQAIEGRQFLHALGLQPNYLILGWKAWQVTMDGWKEIRGSLPVDVACVEPKLYGMRLVQDRRSNPWLVSARSGIDRVG